MAGTLNNFSLEKYQHAMGELCGDMSECKFPDKYFGNIRVWDYIKMIEGGDFQNTDKVLDTGALHTYFCIYLSQFVGEYVCTDNFYWAKREYCQDRTYYQSPEEWCEYIEKKSKGKVKGEEADLVNLQYADNYFDKVMCISVIEHVPDDRKAMSEMLRVVRPGGFVLLTTEYNPTLSKPYDEVDGSYYRVYNDFGIEELVKGYNVVDREMQSMPEGDGFTTLFLKIRKDQ